MSQHRNQLTMQRAFTIVELILIIVVIAILATVSVIGYGSWRDSVAVREVNSDLNGIEAAMENTRNWSDEGYPEFPDDTEFDGSSTTSDIFVGSDGVTSTYKYGDTHMFCVEAVSVVNPSIIYFFQMTYGLKSTGTGACPPVPNTGTVSTIVNGGLNAPTGIAVDSANNLYVAETGNHRILKITPSGTVSTLAGGTTPGYTNSSGINARFNNPYGVAVANNGNVYVVDFTNRRIRQVTPGGAVTAIAGSGAQGALNGQGTTAQFYDPYGIAYDTASGNFFISETGNQRIRTMSSTFLVGTMAGSSVGYLDATVGTSAQFRDPVGVAYYAGDGSVYVVETGNDRIRRVASNTAVTTLAGSTSGFANGTGTGAQFNDPTGIGIKGNIAYIADTGNHRVRMVSLLTGQVVTLAGSGVQGDNDGVGTDAIFNRPTGIAVGNDGVVYIVETDAGQIRKIE